jgi:hypothetical protein
MNWNAELEPIVAQIKSLPWENPEFYKLFVAQIYHFTRYSTRMLAAAAAYTDNSEYHARLIRHIAEENGHEKIALNDLKNLGASIDQYPELGMTRALWETQFYKIQRNPSSLMGYVLSLEIIPVLAYGDVLPRIRAKYGDKCVNFIKVHYENDPDHVEKAIKQVEAMSESDLRLIEENFLQTNSVVQYLLEEIVSKSVGHDHRSVNPLEKRSA